MILGGYVHKFCWISRYTSATHHPEGHPIPRMVFGRPEDRPIFVVVPNFIDHQNRRIGSIIDQNIWSLNIFQYLSFYGRNEVRDSLVADPFKEFDEPLRGPGLCDFFGGEDIFKYPQWDVINHKYDRIAIGSEDLADFKNLTLMLKL